MSDSIFQVKQMVVVSEWAQVAHGPRQLIEVLAVGAARAARFSYATGDTLVAFVAAVERIARRRQIKLQLEGPRLSASISIISSPKINYFILQHSPFLHC